MFAEIQLLFIRIVFFFDPGFYTELISTVIVQTPWIFSYRFRCTAWLSQSLGIYAVCINYTLFELNTDLRSVSIYRLCYVHIYVDIYSYKCARVLRKFAGQIQPDIFGWIHLSGYPQHRFAIAHGNNSHTHMFAIQRSVFIRKILSVGHQCVSELMSLRKRIPRRWCEKILRACHFSLEIRIDFI